MFLDRVGAESPRCRRSWTPRDCSLYALSLGAGWDELAFVTEGVTDEPQRVFPTFVLAGVMAAESGSWADPGFGTGDYQPHEIVHGEQALELQAPIGPSGDVSTWTRVAGIYDKGSGALVVLEIHARDTRSDEPVFKATTSLFVIGHGGFGGERGPRGPDRRAPERDPDHTIAYPTQKTQTLLYSHGGHDTNAIHRDPVVSRAAGFRAPILMGLNTLGIAGRALLHTLADSRPERMRSIGGRFASPGYNGDVLETQIWCEETAAGRVALFRVRNQDGDILLDAGHASLA